MNGRMAGQLDIFRSQRKDHSDPKITFLRTYSFGLSLSGWVGFQQGKNKRLES